MKNPKITQEEIRLIKDAQAGKMLAFNKLFNRYKGFVDHVLYSYLKDFDEAQDLTNIVFLKVYYKLSSFTDCSSFGGWLRIIANRTAIDYLRKIGDKNKLLGENDGCMSLDQVESNENDTINRITYEQLLSEFDRFTPMHKNVCLLFYRDNLTVDQISKSLSMSPGTIKSILSRTRASIKKQFKL
nr:MAG TPA: RNA polymerase sigma factor [Crassvirales sp.]